jgi:hypothetical protein
LPKVPEHLVCFSSSRAPAPPDFQLLQSSRAPASQDFKTCLFACDQQDKSVNVVLSFLYFIVAFGKKKNSRVQMVSNQTAKIHGKTTRDVHLQLIAAKYLVKHVKFGFLLFFGVGRRPRPGHVRQTSVFRQPHFSINHFA